MTSMPTQAPSLQKIKEELELERDKIKAILARRAHKDPKVPGNYITNFPNVGDDNDREDEDVFEFEQYEVDVDIEHILEKRLIKIEEDLKKIEAGQYKKE